MVLSLLALTAFGAPEEKVVFAGGGTDVGNTICYAVVSAASANGGTPVVTYLNATSDLSSSKVTFYTYGTNTFVNAAQPGTTFIPVNATNGFVNGDVIVIRHVATDTYEKRILTTFTTNGVLVVTAAPTVATAAGDVIYRVSAAGSIPVGAATLALTGEGIYAGEKGKPLLLEVDGTSTCQLNAVCAKYVK